VVGGVCIPGGSKDGDQPEVVDNFRWNVVVLRVRGLVTWHDGLGSVIVLA